MPGKKEHIRTTCPRDCYDACGIVVVKRDGAISKVLGDPEHAVSRGALCGKCALAYNGAWRDPAQRLLRPLRRTGVKGAGAFEPVSWDEAIAEIAERLGAIAADPGPEAILHTHYTGTCSHIAGHFPERFFNRLGATEVDPDTICNNAGHVALGYILGTSATGFDPRTARDTGCVVVWGANPSASAPHAHKHWLRETPGKVIVIDPVRHPTAEQADLHLQPFPGSDAALAFALAHVIRRDGLLDNAFVAEHVLGWDEVESTVAECHPQWGEAQTGVPAALIEQAARIFGEGPSMLWLGQGLQRQATGGNIFRACAMLTAITGHIGQPGTGFYYLNGGWRRGLRGGYLTAPHLRRRETPTVSHMDLAARLEDRAKSQALVSWNMNVAASGPEQKRLHAALARDNLFTVVIDLFATDTARFADIVLPAASFLEFDDIVTSYFNLSFSAQTKAAEPMGESLPNQEIFRRLAAAMGFNEPELQESDESLIAHLIGQVGVVESFAELSEKGTVNVFDEPVIEFESLRFPTPSRRIEIASARAEADGHPRTPLPDPDPRPAGGRLRLLSPASPWLMNDSYANDAKVREQLGAAWVALHPEDAAERGLAEGDDAYVANDTGSLTLRVTVSDVIPRGTVLSHKGRWPSLEGSGGNINLLHAGRKSDMGESTAVHGVEVTVAPA